MSNMPDHSNAFSSQPSASSQSVNSTQAFHAQIMFIPIEDEEGNFETATIVEEVQEDVLRESAHLQGYTSRVASNGTRDTGFILILGEIAQQAIAHKDLVIEIFKVGAAAISLLAKQQHVKKVEIELSGDRFSVDEPDKATVERLLDIYEAAHPGKATDLTSSSSMQITATISKTQ